MNEVATRAQIAQIQSAFVPTRTQVAPIQSAEGVNHLEQMLSGIRPHSGTIHVKTWRGGQGFAEFRTSYRQQAIGAGWRAKEQVVRLVGFLGGIPAIKYMKWLEEGRLSDASLEGAFKMLAHEFFDEEEEQYTEKERWISRKQKLDESVEDYHTVFVSNADGAGITNDKDLLRQWSRNLLPSIRMAVQTAAHSNPVLTFQSGVRIAMDVQASMDSEEAPTAYRRGLEEESEDKMIKKVRAIASATAESVVRSMESEIAQAKRDLQKARDEIAAFKEKGEAMPPQRYAGRQQTRYEPYPSRGRGRGRPRGGHDEQHQQYEAAQRRTGEQCERCLSTRHPQSECTFEGICFKCGKRGHIAATCKTRQQQEVGQDHPKEREHPKDERSSA